MGGGGGVARDGARAGALGLRAAVAEECCEAGLHGAFLLWCPRLCHARARAAALDMPPPPRAADGTVPFLSGERIAFSYLTSQKYTGDIAHLDILREGKPEHLSIKVGGRVGGVMSGVGSVVSGWAVRW